MRLTSGAHGCTRGKSWRTTPSLHNCFDTIARLLQAAGGTRWPRLAARNPHGGRVRWGPVRPARVLCRTGSTGAQLVQPATPAQVAGVLQQRERRHGCAGPAAPLPRTAAQPQWGGRARPRWGTAKLLRARPPPQHAATSAARNTWRGPPHTCPPAAIAWSAAAHAAHTVRSQYSPTQRRCRAPLLAAAPKRVAGWGAPLRRWACGQRASQAPLLLPPATPHRNCWVRLQR